MDLNDLATGLVNALRKVPGIDSKSFNEWSPHVRAYFKKRGDELGIVDPKVFDQFLGHGGLVVRSDNSSPILAMRFIWSSDWSSPRAVANKRLLKQLMETGATQCVLVCNAPNSESKWRKELAELFGYACLSMESGTKDVLLVLCQPAAQRRCGARLYVGKCAVSTLLLSH